MPIGLNYSHHIFPDGKRLLPNYLYLLDNIEQITIFDQEHIARHIQDEKLLDMLKHPIYDSAFDDPVIKQILLDAYPYEVLMKFGGQEIPNDDSRNENIITSFNTFFRLDYHKEIAKYCEECNSQAQQKTFAQHERGRYDDIAKATDAFFDFVYALLSDQGHTQEIEGLKQFVANKLDVLYTSGISGNTDANGDKVMVEVGNNTYTTLFHELVHAVNRFFRFSYYDMHDVCNDNYTKTNEGLSNFVAYHLMDAINAKDLDMVDEMTLEPIFFSMYIDIYATMTKEGTNDRKKNFDIIYQELLKFEGDLLTDEKARFYYQRFYKFFHYDQHTYFYPKEMMYYLGYHDILGLFTASDNKKQLLSQCLLGKICL